MLQNRIIAAIIVSVMIVVAIYLFYKEMPEPDEKTDNMYNSYTYPLDTSVIPETANFKIGEFRSRDGVSVPVELYGNVYALMQDLQTIRDFIGVPIVVNSGYRTVVHNSRVGGAKKSTHLFALAADIRAVGKTVRQLYNAIVLLKREGKLNPGGLKAYKTFVHFDIRGYNVTW